MADYQKMYLKLFNASAEYQGIEKTDDGKGDDEDIKCVVVA